MPNGGAAAMNRPNMDESTDAPKSAPLLPIFLIVLVDVLGLTIVLPLLPLYAESFGATAFVASLLVSTYAACQLVAGPLLGGWSDRFGRRKILLLSQCGTLIGFLMIANASALWVIFVGRILDGLTAGNLSVAQAYIADNTAPENRAKSFALIGIAFGLGFMLGPTLAAYTSHFGLGVPFLVAAGLSALSILCTATLLPKGRPPRDHSSSDLPAATRTSIFDLKPWREYFGRPELRRLYVSFFLYLFVFSMFISGFALFAERHYTWQGHPFGTKEIGLLYGLSGAVGIVIQGGLLGRLVKKYGESKLVVAGLLLLGGGFVVLPAVEPVATLVLATIGIAAGNALLRPNLTSLLSRSVEQHEQGAVLGLSQSFASLASITAAPLSGWLIEEGYLQTWCVVAACVCGLTLTLGRGKVRQPRDAHV